MSKAREPYATPAAFSPAAASARSGRRPGQVVLPYTVLGVLMGGLWAVNHGATLWEHTSRLLLIALTVPPLMERVRMRRRRRLGRHGEPRVSLLRLTLLKLGVVALALAATWLLRDQVAGADYWTAAGMAVLVAVAGPLLHPHMIVGERPPRRQLTRQ
ncbi:hypothetical protein OG613_43980 (plasmid) [Streptomyces sp. NBC_00015]|uniref:hypothetical protein n=1 Tax=Streptomyces sp. NBC_00015 TaxID=2903611 RepID=UPI002F91A0A0